MPLKPPCHFAFNPWRDVGSIRRVSSGRNWRRIVRLNSMARPQTRVRVSGLMDVFQASERPVVDGAGYELNQYLGGTVDDIRRDLFGLIDRCGNLDFIITTRFPQNVPEMWPRRANLHEDPMSAGTGWAIQLGDGEELNLDSSNRKNVWLGINVSKQADINDHISDLVLMRALVSKVFVQIRTAVELINLEPVLRHVSSVILPDRETETLDHLKAQCTSADVLCIGGEEPDKPTLSNWR